MKESDIRPADVFQEFLRLSARDAQCYFNPEMRKAVPCPACGSEHYSPAFSKLGFDYVECTECASLYLSPRPPLSEYERYYCDSPSANYWANTFFPSVVEQRREKIFIPRVKQIASLCAEHDFSPEVVMDVGAGYGIFLEEWKKHHSRAHVCAIEPGMAMAEICREKGIEVLETVAERADAWENKADLLTCFEVIEHAHHPLTFVRSLCNLIKPGGYALVSGLGVEGFDIQVLWEKSKSISPPHHINFMSIRGLEILFKRAGFMDVKVITPGKLDVDIVANMHMEAPAIEIGRFVKTMLARGEAARDAFQTFLSDYQLSSHCWIWARK